MNREPSRATFAGDDLDVGGTASTRLVGPPTRGPFVNSEPVDSTARRRRQLEAEILRRRVAVVSMVLMLASPIIVAAGFGVQAGVGAALIALGVMAAIMGVVIGLLG